VSISPGLPSAARLRSGDARSVARRAVGGSGARAARRTGRLAVSVAASLALLAAAGAGVASAAVSHPLISSFTGASTPAGSFGSANGVAVDDTTGDVYVADLTNNVVDKFSSTGTYLCQITGNGSASTSASECDNSQTGAPAPFSFSTDAALAVDNSTNPLDPSAGDLYVVDAGNDVVDQFSSSGTYVGQLTGGTNGPFSSPLLGVAVDPSGNVWVYDGGGNIYQFSATGLPISQFNIQSSYFLTDPGLAVDSDDNVYASVRILPTIVEEFSSTGTDLGTVDGGSAVAETVDPATNELYVDDGSQIDERGPSGIALDQFGGSELTASNKGGIAVNGVSGEIYVANPANGTVYVYGPTEGPRVAPEPCSAVSATGATFSATVNPEGSDTTYQFQYGTSTRYGQSVPAPAADAGSGTSPVAVSADATGLQGGTTYHYRVAATDANGNTTLGADTTCTTLPVPVVDAASVTNLTSSGAQLNAQINPEGTATTYHFEYGTSTSYGTSVPVPDAAIGSGTSDVSVSQQITGLSPSTEYHWRVVATGANGTTTGVDHTFIYDTSAHALPDGRAYELVTPPQDNGAVFGHIFSGFNYDISGDGNRVIAGTQQCFGDATGCTADRSARVGSTYEFTRTSGGWTASSLTPSAAQYQESAGWGGNAAAGTALFSIPTPPAGEDDFYARSSDGTLTDIGPATPPADGAQGLNLGDLLATADLSHVVYWLNEIAWPFDAGPEYIYEYAGSGNQQPVLVPVTGGEGSTDLISDCPSGSHLNKIVTGSLSDDGNAVFFEVGKCPGGTGANASTPVPANEVYARVDGTTADAHTVLLSAPSPTDCSTACQSAAARDATFVGASDDGTKAYFLSTQQLLDSATEDPNPNDSTSQQGCANTSGANGCNLYLYDFAAPAGQNLVDASAGDTSGLGPEVQSVLAISSDGSHVYFVAKGVLTNTANGFGQTAQAGAENLYVYERDSAQPGGRLSFITALSPNDPDLQDNSTLLADVTPDGQFLVFTSFGDLTPDDSSSNAQQVFRYDAASGQLTRLSIGDRGFGDNGNVAGGGCGIGVGAACAADASIVAPRDLGVNPGPARTDPSMSDDGTRVFFESPLALAPGAMNSVQVTTTLSGQPAYAQNVYEWEQGGVGSCPAAQASGCVYLISDGRDVGVAQARSDVTLLESDTSGDNVFFTTADPLVAQDDNTGDDIYDARVGGGFASSPAPAGCSGDTCQGSPAPPPTPEPVATVTFTGPGNQAGEPAASVRVTRRVVSARRIVLSVKVPGAGRVTITGREIASQSRSVGRAGTFRFVLRLNKSALRVLRRRHRLRLKVRVGYADSAVQSASTMVTMTVRSK
jgi:hypothetical protein